MPVYVGGRKAKELYFGGRKIKEAWLNGKKVFSSGPQAWRNGVIYRKGDLVTNRPRLSTTIYTFQCIKDHTSDRDTEPYNGIAESGFWQLVH